MTPLELLRHAPLILGEGSMYERLRRDGSVEYDPHLAHAALIYDSGARAVYESVHREYLDIGQRRGIPMLATTATWRANRDRLERSGFAGRPVNQDNVRHLRALTASLTAAPIAVAGMLGFRGDSYEPLEAMSAEAAQEFHAFQADALAEAAPDLLFAATLPAVSEALGLARAMARTELPYIISFVVRDDGAVLDGTPLPEALAAIDDGAPAAPIGYFANCVHPNVLEKCFHAHPSIVGRLIGLQANTSQLRPKDLEGSAELLTEAPDVLAEHMGRVRDAFGLRAAGGCCGTSTAHIDAMANRLQSA